MSKSPNNNLNTKELEALLAKKNSHGEGLDDFEKEALDGFIMLDNDEDPIALKEKLDARIHTEVFSKEKKSTPLYWLAAAGLAFVIGLSIFFIVNNQALETKKSNLAIASPKKAPQEEIPNVINQEQTSAAPIELKKSNSATHVEDDEKKLTSSRAREKTSDLVVAAKQQPITTALAYNAETEVEGQKEVMAAPPVQAAKGVLEGEIPANKDNDEGQQDVVSNYDDKKIGSITKEASGSVAKNESKKQKQAAPEMASSVSFAEPSKNKENLPTTNANCFYIGGETTLNKEVKEELASKKITAAFSATLFINKKAKVEKVEFTDSKAITADEQKIITATLTSLKDFRIIKWPKKTNLIEYSFVFKP